MHTLTISISCKIYSVCNSTNNKTCYRIVVFFLVYFYLRTEISGSVFKLCNRKCVAAAVHFCVGYNTSNKTQNILCSSICIVGIEKNPVPILLWMSPRECVVCLLHDRSTIQCISSFYWPSDERTTDVCLNVWRRETPLSDSYEWKGRLCHKPLASICCFSQFFRSAADRNVFLSLCYSVIFA